MRIAFKEWAIVVDALGRGDQIIILRKGGISEGRGGFKVEHEQFLLFPTLFHQQRESVTDSALFVPAVNSAEWPGDQSARTSRWLRNGTNRPVPPPDFRRAPPPTFVGSPAPRRSPWWTLRCLGCSSVAHHPEAGL